MTSIRFSVRLINILRTASLTILAVSYFPVPVKADYKSNHKLSHLWRDAEACLESDNISKCARGIAKKTRDAFETNGQAPGNTVLLIERLLKLNDAANYHETDQFLQDRLRVYQTAADRNLYGRDLLDYYSRLGPEYQANVAWQRHVLESSDNAAADSPEDSPSDRNNTPNPYGLPNQGNSPYPNSAPSQNGVTPPNQAGQSADELAAPCLAKCRAREAPYEAANHAAIAAADACLKREAAAASAQNREIHDQVVCKVEYQNRRNAGAAYLEIQKQCLCYGSVK